MASVPVTDTANNGTALTLDATGVRMSANQMRALKAETGKTLTELMGDEVDAMQATVWLQKRREGSPVTWDEAGDIELSFAEAEPDPGNGGGSPSSPPSATTGE